MIPLGVSDVIVGGERLNLTLKPRYHSRSLHRPPEPSPDRSYQADSSCRLASAAICRSIANWLCSGITQVQPRVSAKPRNGAIVGIDGFVARVPYFQSLPR